MRTLAGHSQTLNWVRCIAPNGGWMLESNSPCQTRLLQNFYSKIIETLFSSCSTSRSVTEQQTLPRAKVSGSSAGPTREHGKLRAARMGGWAERSTDHTPITLLGSSSLMTALISASDWRTA